MQIFNTLTGKKETFAPLEEGRVGMYTCGPTVYQNVHIGNLRTFVFQDILRRLLLARNYKVRHVMNITDVDDKTIRNAGEAGQSLADYTRVYKQRFLEDIGALRIQMPEVMPCATEHIPEMVQLVEQLRQKELTYGSDGSIYFRIDRFPGYGRLSRIDPENLKPGLRSDQEEYDKENPRDFVLWKAARDGEPAWDTSIGRGRPGWHLECSAMSMKYLGQSFDIHCGGVDLIFPHHENEIAQSEGATGRPFVKYWVHCEHLFVEGEKMSKSAGNFYTLQHLLDRGFDPRALRYLLFSVHYRKQFNFTFDGMRQVESALQRISDFLVRAREAARGENHPEIPPLVKRAREEFEASLDDDINVPNALGAIFDLVRNVNSLLDRAAISQSDLEEIERFLGDCDQILDVLPLERVQAVDAEVQKLLDERLAARQRRDFRESDRIRDLLYERGIIVEDTRDGMRWKRK